MAFHREASKANVPCIAGSGNSMADIHHLHTQESARIEADEAASEAVPQARIVAYSDSDSDDPMMPSLPFRRRRADGGSDSDNNADSASTSAASEKKSLFPWRGWNRQKETSQVGGFS